MVGFAFSTRLDFRSVLRIYESTAIAILKGVTEGNFISLRRAFCKLIVYKTAKIATFLYVKLRFSAIFVTKTCKNRSLLILTESEVVLYTLSMGIDPFGKRYVVLVLRNVVWNNLEPPHHNV